MALPLRPLSGRLYSVSTHSASASAGAPFTSSTSINIVLQLEPYAILSMDNYLPTIHPTELLLTLLLFGSRMRMVLHDLTASSLLGLQQKESTTHSSWHHCHWTLVPSLWIWIWMNGTTKTVTNQPAFLPKCYHLCLSNTSFSLLFS